MNIEFDRPCIVTFTKKDGSERTIRGTCERRKTKVDNENTILMWDEEENGYRCFDKRRLIRVVYE